MNTATKENTTMKTTAALLFAAALACVLAASMTGCATRSGGLSPATINSGLASSNRVGVAIANGQMVSSIMDKDSVLGAYADVAKAAISNGQEVALIGLSHGADKKPNVETTSKTEETLQDVLAQGIKAAKSGGSEAELAKAGVAIVKGLGKLAAGDDSAPAADNSSANVFALFAGTGANAAGVGAMAEGRMTRVEAIKAARASSVTTTTDTRTETVSADGLATIRELAKLQAEIDKAKLSTGGAASPAPSRPGLTPAGEGSGGVTPPPVAPDSSGSGAVEPSSARAYVAKNYPGLRLGGGNEEGGKDRAPIESNLWKPIRENGGNLCVIIAHSKYGVVKRVMVDDEVLDFDAIGNGWRLHTNADKSGGAYSGKIQIVTSTGTWAGRVSDVNKKQGFDLSKAASSNDLQPGAGTPPGESTAP